MVAGSHIDSNNSRKGDVCLPVDSDIQSQQLNKSSVVAESKEGRKIVRVIFRRVNVGELALSKNVTVDTASDVGEFGNAMNKV